MSKGRKRGAALAGVGLLGLLAWLFRGAIPGLGVDSPAPVDGDGPEAVQIVAKGDQCTVAGVAKACADVCADIQPTERVSIDGTDGAHGAVTGLEKCLRAKGLSEVAVKNR